MTKYSDDGGSVPMVVVAILAGCIAAGVFSDDKHDTPAPAPDSVYVYLDKSIRLYETSDMIGTADHAITPPPTSEPWHIEADKRYLAIRYESGLPVKKWIYSKSKKEN